MKNLILGLLQMTCLVISTTVYYDSYYGRRLSDAELQQHEKANTTFWCVNEIEDPCDPNEGRRLDGSCNNLKNPTRGASHTPFYRILPPAYSYDKDFEPRKSKSGKELPLARYLRTSLLPEARIPDQQFTHLLTYFWIFIASDFTGPHDTVNFVHWRPYCCQEKGKSDNMCVRITVPNDDPVHRFSDIRCLNNTRPISFQSSKCIPNNTSPERLDTATPLLDLSTIYGRDQNVSYKKARLLKGGLLKYEVENGKTWPPSWPPNRINICYGNERPFEVRCHSTPDDATNSILGVNLGSIWFWRLHNYIATKLGEINKCWNDDKLFETARDINIAVASQIYFYELLATMLGKKNLVEEGVLSSDGNFRDKYKENVMPQISLEYPYVLRWVHTLQEGIVKMYDYNGNYMKRIPIVNVTMRTGYLALDNNIDYITQGSFRQGSGKFDHAVDPDIAEVGLLKLQKALDVPTNDLVKNRYFGFQPYVKYREHCFKKRYEKFEDLQDVIEPERLEILKDVYEHVEDIDLISGIWTENNKKGSHVPKTFYCILVEQMKRALESDRHWYERKNRPNAFNKAQLQEIRKATIALMLCYIGDGVTHIQPNAFRRVHPETNRIGGCNELDPIDFWAWEDNSCDDETNKLNKPDKPCRHI